MNMGELKVYLLCRYANESNLYTSWISKLPFSVEVIEENPAEFTPPADCGIVIAHDHFRWEECHALRKIYEQRKVPVLVLADGVLEYRNTWENPTIPASSMYQPLLADKIACIGHQSARMIQSWGNAGKVEIVGLPRLDPLLGVQTVTSDSESFRLVVATANTPAFSDAQYETVLNSLKAIQSGLKNLEHSELAGRIQVDWRLTAGLDKAIGIQPVESSVPLIEAIQDCDAVITTPSTIFLESALLGKPTAILDFSNSPQFTNAAWQITSPDHVEATIKELANPPQPKMLFQDLVLQDNLRCESPAVPRMVELVVQMVEIGAKHRAEFSPIEMPSRILECPNEGIGPSNNKMASSAMTLTAQDKQRLEGELSQAIHRLGTLPQELSDKNQQIAQLQAALDESRRRVADVRVRLFKLRKILGIGKENQTEQSAAPPETD